MSNVTALVVAIGSVAIGGALVFLPHARRVIFVVQLLAVAAAVGVVLLHLLPHAIEGAGWIVLLAVAVGFGVPTAIERAGRAQSGRAALVADEIAYAGLIVHSVGDGVALGGYGDDAWVMLALASHTVPIAALVALRFEALRSRWAGAGRAAGLALATVAGVLLAGVVGAESFERVEPWMDATVAGLLLHISLHAIHRHEHGPHDHEPGHEHDHR